jgi:hypothetical protein
MLSLIETNAINLCLIFYIIKKSDPIKDYKHEIILRRKNRSKLSNIRDHKPIIIMRRNVLTKKFFRSETVNTRCKIRDNLFLANILNLKLYQKLS